MKERLMLPPARESGTRSGRGRRLIGMQEGRLAVSRTEDPGIALPALAYWLLGLNAILAFWLAYNLTRPLGASFADWIGRPHNTGGLGLGTGPVSLGLTILIAGFVGSLTVTRKDVQGD